MGFEFKPVQSDHQILMHPTDVHEKEAFHFTANYPRDDARSCIILKHLENLGEFRVC